MALNSGSGLNSVFDVNYLNYAYDNQDYPWTPITFSTVNMSGSFAATATADTMAATGLIGQRGALTITQNADTMSASGKETYTGAFAATAAADTMASSGKETYTGTLAATATADTMAASAKETYTGTFAATQNADIMAASATEIYTGTFASIENADTMAASGMSVDTGIVAGTFASIENADTMAATGNIAIPIVIQPDQSIGRFQWPRPKRPKQLKPYHIDWNAIEERRSATFKQSIQDMFFPPEAVEEEEAEEYAAELHIAASFTDALTVIPPNYHELELLLLLA